MVEWSKLWGMIEEAGNNKEDLYNEEESNDTKNK